LTSIIDIDRVALILREAADTEIMPRFRALGAEHVRKKTSAIDLVTEAMKRPSTSSMPHAAGPSQRRASSVRNPSQPTRRFSAAWARPSWRSSSIR
jgi:hypothetical protein